MLGGVITGSFTVVGLVTEAGLMTVAGLVIVADLAAALGTVADLGGGGGSRQDNNFLLGFDVENIIFTKTHFFLYKLSILFPIKC